MKEAATFFIASRCQLRTRDEAFAQQQLSAGTDHRNNASLSSTSKLSVLLGACYRAPHATQSSACQAVCLVSICATTDPSIYAMLLPTLETIISSRGGPGVAMTAAAGNL